MNTADVLVEGLIAWGVDTLFGLPGDGINPIMEALRGRKDKIRFIQVRHEESAGFMACAYAKYTGRIGVCLATSGPGGIHLLNGVYDARLDSQPVLAITGLQFHDLISMRVQQDVALDRVFEDACVYNERVMGPAHLENVLDLAIRTALSRKGPAHITIPVDIQEANVKLLRSFRNVPNHSLPGLGHAATMPQAEALKDAAAIINAGKKTAILAGQGALHAASELEAFARKRQAPVAKALLGKAVLPDDSPYTTGQLGLLGTRPSQEIMEACDTLLIVGSSFPYMEFLPRPGQAKAIQIDRDPARIGLRYPIEVGLVGDSKPILAALTELAEPDTDGKFLKEAQKKMAHWRKSIEDEGKWRVNPVKPQALAHELAKRLPETSIVSCDSGTITTWWARHMPVKQGQMHSVSGTLASMANALPYALAAQIAHPDRLSLAIVGDGGFSMLMGEFVTAVKYKLPIKVVVFKNDTLGMIKWEQMAFLGNPEYGCELETMDFSMFAIACGAVGMKLEASEKLESTLDEFLGCPGPALLEAKIDPFEPPMPPKITFEQARKFASSIIKGEPNREKIVMTVIADRVRKLT
jgi:pyruvate dehydrogenase (quinone)/pyruvate oxidase